MRNATELLVQYAAYHRDRRNIATHLIGIPLIVFAVGVLLAPVATDVGGVRVSLAWVLWAVITVWYLTRGSLALAVAVSAVSAVLFALGQVAAAGGSWLACGVGSFVLGWVLQFVGHYWEGRKPAFADDLVGLLVGPMFIVAEALFALGWNPALRAEIEARAGPARGADGDPPARQA